MIARTLSVMSPAAVSRSTPKGLSVAAAVRAISSTITSSDIVEAPRQPKPPALDTAAANSW
jgi:hypothetical protein